MTGEKVEWYHRTKNEQVAVWNNTSDPAHDEKNLCIIIARNLGFESTVTSLTTIETRLEPLEGFCDKLPELAGEATLGIILTGERSGNCYGIRAKNMKNLRDALALPEQAR